MAIGCFSTGIEVYFMGLTLPLIWVDVIAIVKQSRKTGVEGS